MKTTRHLFLSFLAILFSSLLLATAASATLIADYTTTTWNFTYNQKVGGSYNHNLELGTPSITKVEYINGEVADALPWTLDDPIVAAAYTLGGNLTSPGAKSGTVPPANPFQTLTGDGIFRITEGGNTYLTGVVDMSSGILFNSENTGYALAQILITNLDTSMDTSGSRYISEMNSLGWTELFVTLRLDVSSGTNDFTVDSSGTGSGKIIPEPSSLVLMGSCLAGMAVLKRKRR